MPHRMMFDSDVFELLAADEPTLNGLATLLEQQEVQVLSIRPQLDELEARHRVVMDVAQGLVEEVPEPLEGWSGSLSYRDLGDDQAPEGRMDYQWMSDAFDRVTALVTMTAEQTADILVLTDESLRSYVAGASPQLEVWSFARLQEFATPSTLDAAS